RSPGNGRLRDRPDFLSPARWGWPPRRASPRLLTWQPRPSTAFPGGLTHGRNLRYRPCVHLLDVPRHARGARLAGPPRLPRAAPPVGGPSALPGRHRPPLGRHPRAGREQPGRRALPPAGPGLAAVLPGSCRPALRLATHRAAANDGAAVPLASRLHWP